MRIQILRGTVCNGQPVVAGDMVETDEVQAKYLIQLKKAIAVGVGAVETAQAAAPGERALSPRGQAGKGTK